MSFHLVLVHFRWRFCFVTYVTIHEAKYDRHEKTLKVKIRNVMLFSVISLHLVICDGIIICSICCT